LELSFDISVFDLIYNR